MENPNGSFKGIAAVFLPVRDLERSVAWYSEKMGFELIRVYKEHVAAGMKVSPAIPHLCLIQVHDYRPLTFPANDFECDIFFNYIVDDIDRVHNRLRHNGVEVNDIHSSLDGSFRHFTVSDIDGNSISIVNG